MNKNFLYSFPILVFFFYSVCMADIKIKELSSFNEKMLWLEKEIQKTRAAIKKHPPRDIRKELESHLKEIRANYDDTRIHFIEQASGVTFETIKKEDPLVKKDLSEEFYELLKPVIESLKKISERPRKIERLKQEYVLREKELANQKEALEKLKLLLKDRKYNELFTRIKQTIKELESNLNELEIELASSNRALEKELSERKSFFDELKDILASFFKTRGKNLLISLTFLLLILWIFIFFRKKIFKANLFHSKLHFLAKPVKTIYYLIAGTTAIAGAIISLYVLNDWVLVTAILIILAGLLWSSKQLIPKVINESRQMFNLGPVREGERIIWNGIPWDVYRTGFFNLLKNDLLEGGEIRVTAKEILNHHSRPSSSKEPLFPSKTGDWVKLENSILGKIIFQSPDQVILEKKGGSLVTYTAQNFFNSKLENLSQGFRIELVFGLDYNLQAKITKEIPKIFKEELSSILSQHSEIKDALKQLNVSFHSAGASSLNLWISADFSGTLASENELIKRLLEEGAVDICNKYNYTIPFTQLTIHGIEQAKV